MASKQSIHSTGTFKLGEFRIYPKRRIIRGPSGEITVEPKVMAVLQMLVERPGEVITRQEFIDTIWVKEYSGDESLTRAVSHLRKVFHDTSSPQPKIVTIPKTGYRLIQDGISIKTSAKKSIPFRTLAIWVAAVLVVIMFLVFIFFKVGYLLPGSSYNHSNQTTIAVSPFVSHSELPEDQLLALGLTDEVLSALSRSPSISVITLMAPATLPDENGIDLAAIARYTGASHIVKGSMSRSRSEVRVSVHLVDVDGGQVDWSDVVVRPENELFTIPTQVAVAIQRALGADLEQPRLRPTSKNPEAYEAYLTIKAMQRMPPMALPSSVIAELEAIVEKDPGLAEAWGLLAQIRLDLNEGMASSESKVFDVDELGSLKKARREANTAISLNPGSVDALLALAIIDYRERTIDLAQMEIRLLSLLGEAPNHPILNLRLGIFMIKTGRFEAAVSFLGKAVQLEPLANFPGAFFTDALLNSGRRDEAQKFLEMRQMQEVFKITYTGLTLNLLDGDFDGARKFLQAVDGNVIFGPNHLIELPYLPVDSMATEHLGRLFTDLVTSTEQGKPAGNPAIAEEFIAAADKGLIPHFHVAQLLASAGYLDEALALTRDRLAQGDMFMYESGVLLRPAFELARQDPGIMEYFNLSGRLEYWWKTGNWPDFCTAQQRLYDCEQAALQYLETAR